MDRSITIKVMRLIQSLQEDPHYVAIFRYRNKRTFWEKSALKNRPSDWPRLVEMAWIECESDGTIIAEFESVIQPDSFTISRQASAIHGITTQIALEDGLPLITVLKKFHAALDNCALIIGHNVDFDLNVVAAESLRAGISSRLQFLQRKCTMKSSVSLCKLKRGTGYKYPTLAELHFFLFGEPFPKNHRALSDARACMKCFFELKKRGIF
ncbi:MAG: 3'-5' exonuclease [Methanoregula sp.]|jgi:DNA polymerase-3 subunit alpha/DNA polymerase-3 subunit epsilon|nr:3'-5' exonuclease [Methanoregula sp.]